ncbi:hypothetical protein POM88_037100 [Heracleum sosnowskyi]|uniref:TPX2 C-terminal domain-containing protein n=1 Tax=Heracleum sosnowskyi TaxID=360622 RepID=A0AAD8HRA0_9APIA|nr:hypothetical protein POM88_037100 [Heracleum sosnowskyi]
MATDTDHRAYCSHLIHPSGFSSEPQYEIQDVSISELVNHGSISFGRFAVETLEWEKRSVFSHNRYQEELEKFKAPGIVAQKKAYFEEYYRKIRAAKKLQSEQQEISQSDPCDDKLSCTSQVQNSAEICNSNEVMNSDGTAQISISVEKMSGHQDIIAESNKGVECVEKAAKIPASSAKMYSKSSLPNKVVSVSLNLNANKLKARTLPSEVKGTVPLAKEENTVYNRTRRDAAKLPEKGKALTGYDGSRRSVMDEKAAHLLQRNVKCKNIAVHKNPTRVQSSTNVSQPEVSRHIPPPCSNTKLNSDKANLNFGLKSKTTSRHANVTNSMNNLSVKRPSAGVSGKTLQGSSRNVMQRSGQSENQKPKIISMNRQTETNPNIRIGTQMKETRSVNGRVPNAATSTSSTANKATSYKLEKNVISHVNHQFAPTSGRREQRNKLPSWR